MTTTDLMDRVPGFHGSSLMRRIELDRLIELLPAQSWALEIGTYEGVTAAMLAAARPESLVISIDPFIDHDDKDQRRRSGAERFGNWRKNQRLNQRLWVGDIDGFHAICARTFDLILVDGAHHYVAVLNDLLFASSLLTPVGVIAVHDYAGSNEYPEVRDATNEFTDRTTFRVVDTVESLAILRG